jgi:hypothetical protein
MSDAYLHTITRTNEESYFQKAERELLQRLRKEEQRRLRREKMSEALNIRRQSILEELEVLGFTPETVSLLRIVPMVYVAWSDQQVSESEEDYIVHFASSRGLLSNPEARTLLSRWFRKRPPSDFFDRCHTLLCHICRDLPREEAIQIQSDLQIACIEVADCEGGFLGLGSRTSREEIRSISDLEERGLLERAS